jgi:hypothetical protein
MAAVELTEDSEKGPEMWAILIHDGLFVPWPGDFPTLIMIYFDVYSRPTHGKEGHE